MPRAIELTVELSVLKVSCPGVWLCQDGSVSLNVFALGSSFQTSQQPPIFPLLFNDVFYLRKRFDNVTCNLGNLCCLLKDETMYCELVQWCGSCQSNYCTVLAQYLGALSDMLFPPTMCQANGVDLLMRRSSAFPGILSPKIEIRNKLRLDELLTRSNKRAQTAPQAARRTKLLKPCMCSKGEIDAFRQKQVCHTPLYHRLYCYNRARSRSRSPSICPHERPASEGSWSLCDLTPDPPNCPRNCPSPTKSAPISNAARQGYQTYHLTHSPDPWTNTAKASQKKEYGLQIDDSESDDEDNGVQPYPYLHHPAEDQNVKQRKTLERIILESHYIEQECDKLERRKKKGICQHKPTSPCGCEICLRYHQMFLSNSNSVQSIHSDRKRCL